MRKAPWDGYQGSRPLTHEYMHELFDYADGELYWKERPYSHFKDYKTWLLWRRRYAGTLAGTRPNYQRFKKYRRITIDCNGYYLSRVVWLYHYGQWPEHCWFKDGDRQNCAISNLESISTEENLKRAESIGRSYALRRWATGQWSPYMKRLEPAPE